jgi:segregation and condensation protein A
MELINMIEKPEEFKIKLEVFEGPFDLLLHLIEQEKVAIHEISINKITAAYLEYLHAMQQHDLDVSSEFLVMAAILIELKSKSLLPANNPDNEDLLAEAEAEKKALLEKLVEYKIYKTLARELAEKERDNLYVHTRDDINQELIETYPGEKIIHVRNAEIDFLVAAFNRVWQDFQLRVVTRDIKHLSQRLVSVKEKMHNILERLKKPYAKISFYELFDNATSKFDIIATFIGILELARQQFIYVSQNVVFDDIEIVARKNIDEKNIELDDNEYNKIQGAVETNEQQP